jgi:hypothetical protein
MNTKLYFLLVFSFFFLSGFSQDIIVKKDGTKMQVIVKEITDKQIKFVDYKDPDGVVFTIDKVLVKEVIMKTGMKIKPEAPEENEWYFSDDKINLYSVDFLAFGSGVLSLGYERALVPGKSYFLRLNIYGLGIPRENISKSGAGFMGGYRYRLGSFFNPSSYRPYHVLNGMYVEPIGGFSFGSVKFTPDYYWSEEEKTYNHAILFFGIGGGDQLVIQRTFVVDFSLGFMYYLGQDDKGPIRAGTIYGAKNILFFLEFRIGMLGGKQRLTDKYKKRANNVKEKVGERSKPGRFF